MEQTIFSIFIAALGLVVGSFLNTIIVRLPQAILNKEPFALATLWTPSWSQCQQCKKQIKPLDLIPLLNYFWLKGQCRYCKGAIARQYPIVEGLTCLLSLMVALRFGISFNTLAALILMWGLIALALIDAKHFLLPGILTLPLLGLGLLFNLFGALEPFHNAVLGAVFGYGIFWGIYWAYRITTDKEALGQGDFKFLAMLGAWLGWTVLPIVILLAALLASIWGLRLMKLKQATLQTRLPFGVFLAIAGAISLFWGENLIACYQQAIGII